jgi:hypothetical protein
MELKKIMAGLMMVLVVVVTIAAVTNPQRVGLFYSTDGSGNPGTWAAMTGTGTPFTGSVEPVGMFTSTDGSGNPGTWVAMSASSFGSGTVSGLTAGYIPQATSATALSTNSPIENSLTVSNTMVVHGKNWAVMPAGGAAINPLGILALLSSSGDASIDLVGTDWNARTGIRMRLYNGGTIADYFQMGMNQDLPYAWSVKDDLNTNEVIKIPSNTMPALSITGNAKGATLLTIQTNTNCAVNSVSPAACVAAAAGAFVVPTTTTSYVVNTTAVQATSRILISPRTYAGDLPSSPTCVVPAITSNYVVSAITAGTSFTLTLPSTSGQTCWNYEIVN